MLAVPRWGVSWKIRSWMSLEASGTSTRYSGRCLPPTVTEPAGVTPAVGAAPSRGRATVVSARQSRARPVYGPPETKRVSRTVSAGSRAGSSSTAHNTHARAYWALGTVQMKQPGRASKALRLV